MKRLSLILALAIFLAGGAMGAMSAPAQAQYGYNYPPPPQNIYATPWVGPHTPWVFYQGDWFLNGVLYNFFGNQYGWAPYYTYPATYIVRPKTGMRRSGIPGINATLITGKISGASIPIGPDTNPASVMTRNFIIATIMAKGKVGIGASMGFVLPKMLGMAVRPAKAFGPEGHKPGKNPPDEVKLPHVLLPVSVPRSLTGAVWEQSCRRHQGVLYLAGKPVTAKRR